ncbi:MAG TPA: chorismate pyruvate-lyase family protein [Micromonosporaceae bacterium]
MTVGGTATDLQALVARHFVAQASRPVELRDVAVDTLRPEQRCLLATDGMVSTTLETYHLEPVVAHPISQDDVPVPRPQADWLDVPEATVVLRRRVVIRGQDSGVAYVAAESLLVPSRLPHGFGPGIGRFPSGLGAALAATGIESRRELLWFGAATLPEWYPTPVPGRLPQRTYRVIHRGEPISLITESFLR